MLYLREGTADGLFDLWSRTVAAGEHVVSLGLTEIEVRRIFRDQAVDNARKAVTLLIRDLQPRGG